ncbi:MAG TPA: hypothetical protein VMM15_10325 [Bradyrhizobium sp.]|nr:hypothetical protein [Bradyrhizobium sp.]
MDTIAGFPLLGLEITKDGQVFKPEQAVAIRQAVRDVGAARLTDLIVISHGWNNDMAEARQLYQELLGNIASLMPNHGSLAQRKFAVVGVFWPSKEFADSELIPAGGAASLGEDGADLSSSALKQKIESLKGTFDFPDEQPLDRAKALVDGIEDSVAKQEEFVKIIRSLVPGKPADITDDASDRFFKDAPREILAVLAGPSIALPADNAGGVSLDMDDVGGAASLGDFFSGVKAAAWRLLNYATYYQMKERAGVVGKALNGVLAPVRSLRPDLAIHLIGHSFGARVVAAAADGASALRPSSLSLLQGAFSHNGFTEKFDGSNDGFFRKVVAQSKIAGPIIATHTVNDKAVGIAYPLASRLASDNAKALGDENDQYGGIGRNGAVRMKSAECVQGTLLPATGAYQFLAGKVYNLKADAFITGHGDVKGPQVANAIIFAFGA